MGRGYNNKATEQSVQPMRQRVSEATNTQSNYEAIKISAYKAIGNMESRDLIEFLEHNLKDSQIDNTQLIPIRQRINEQLSSEIAEGVKREEITPQTNIERYSTILYKRRVNLSRCLESVVVKLDEGKMDFGQAYAKLEKSLLKLNTDKKRLVELLQDELNDEYMPSYNPGTVGDLD